jgi:hypothetical protein
MVHVGYVDIDDPIAQPRKNAIYQRRMLPLRGYVQSGVFEHCCDLGLTPIVSLNNANVERQNPQAQRCNGLEHDQP